MFAVEVEVVNTHPTSRIRRAAIRRGVEHVVREEMAGRAAVTVVLVSDDDLLQLNREFLKHDYYTDVITFGLEEEPLEGEVYISVDRAREQAAEFGVSLHNELCRLAVHGALHLAGYDDGTEEEREVMRNLEDRYLTLL